MRAFYLRCLLLFLILGAGRTMVVAQKAANNDKLALQYYEQKEFEKANVYFEQLFDRNPNTWFPYYYKSLLGARDYDRAEKVTKKHLRYNKYDVYLYVYLGRIYQLKEDPKKEKEADEKALKELMPVQPYLQQLVLAFTEQKKYDQALAAYNKARKHTPDYPFFYERAEVYRAKNDLVSMINEYLDALEYQETELFAVQNHLQNSLGYDDEEGGIRNPLLKQELQKRIQKNPQKVVLTEFLIFIQKQQKDFNGAFVQSRALDKRMKEEGQRIYELAKICVSNGDYETAKRCYDYLTEKGPSSLYYDISVIEGLNMEYLALAEKPKPSTESLTLLETRLNDAYKKYSKNFLNAQLLKSLASVKAYYLGKPDEAIILLTEFLEQPGIEAGLKAEFKIMLADIHLVSADIWEASLLYSQVEKDFKYEPIGKEAKFRNAKLSFYAGDFEWAKTQADVLKGGTTQLISNDAIDLSLIISDAIGVDTNDVPLRMFASAELMILQHRYSEAIIRMDSINQLFSSNTLGDDIYFKKAAIYEKLGQYAETEAMYKNILEYYPSDLYGDDAQFRLAELYENKLNDKDKARAAYQEVLLKYPGSIFTVEARKRFRNLRGDNLNN